MNQQFLEHMGIHDKPKCGAPYDVYRRTAGIVTVHCHKPEGHDELHSGGDEGGAYGWGPGCTENDTASAYRHGLAAPRGSK